jgi:hypothetical protein
MYKILGQDGKEYGPVSAEVVRQWVAEGRINAQTQVQASGSTEWVAIAQVPELSGSFASAAASPGAGPAPLRAAVGASQPRQGLAITSLVLGILSMVCFGLFAGIPAVICGHIARGRVKRAPAQYGGGGLALAGLITGYLGIVFTFILAGLFLPALARAKGKAESIKCMTNMKQIGLGCRIWANDNNERYPFNVSTKDGGTLEFCAAGPDAFDKNSVKHFQAMSNELNSPKILWCPADSSKHVGLDFPNLQDANVSYQLRSGPQVRPDRPREVLGRCPIHGHILYSDGSVMMSNKR